jgi:hypothetical protein
VGILYHRVSFSTVGRETWEMFERTEQLTTNYSLVN